MKTFIATLLLASALTSTVIAQADPEVSQIQALRHRVESGEANSQFQRLEIAYCGVGRYPKGLPRWSAWMAQPEMRFETRADWHDTQRDAIVFLQDRRVISVRMRCADPSGRWDSESHAVYREDGSLAFQETRLTTQDFWCQDSRGPRRGETRLQVKEETYFNQSGQIGLTNRIVLGYQGLPVESFTFQPRTLTTYSSVQALPFHPVIVLALQRLQP